MIGLGKSCNGGGALMNYVYDVKRGFELDRNLLAGNTPKQLIEEIKLMQNFNSRATNKTFSFVLSPDPKDFSKLTYDNLKEMSKEFLELLDINPNEQQFVTFVHRDKAHLHLHFIVNRVLANGKLISDNYIGKRCQWAAHKIAMKRDLISAKNKMIENIKTKEGIKTLKKSINTIHNTFMNQNPNNFETYQKNMFQYGIDVIPVYNSNNIVQGFNMIDLKNSQTFKASEINRQNGILELYNNPKIIKKKLKF